MPDLCPLPIDACERLLRESVFGRVAFAGCDGPEIVPVNYAVVDDAILIRTDPSSALAANAIGERVAFQIDLVDHERWHGWSVVARGVAERVAGDDDRLSTALPGPRPWAEGERTLLLRIPWSELTGRRVGRGVAMTVRQVLR